MITCVKCALFCLRKVSMMVVGEVWVGAMGVVCQGFDMQFFKKESLSL